MRPILFDISMYAIYFYIYIYRYILIYIMTALGSIYKRYVRSNSGNGNGNGNGKEVKVPSSWKETKSQGNIAKQLAKTKEGKISAQIK